MHTHAQRFLSATSFRPAGLLSLLLIQEQLPNQVNLLARDLRAESRIQISSCWQDQLAAPASSRYTLGFQGTLQANHGCNGGRARRTHTHTHNRSTQNRVSEWNTPTE